MPKQILLPEEEQALMKECRRIFGEDFITPSRKRIKVLMRYAVIQCFINILNYPLKRTGMLLGGRDHSTVIHARDGLDRLNREEKQAVTEYVKKIEQEFKWYELKLRKKNNINGGLKLVSANNEQFHLSAFNGISRTMGRSESSKPMLFADRDAILSALLKFNGLKIVRV